MRRTSLHIAICLLAASFPARHARAAEPGSEAPDYARDIRPILSENCYMCHGPDAAARKAELRLDQIDAAIEEGAIIPGEPDASPLVARIMAASPKLVMPPPKSNKTLTDEQKRKLAAWIRAGAEHKGHWAFEPIMKPEIPISGEGAALMPIDALVRERLAREGLAPAPEADRETLLRRLSFDLTGLPPTIEEIDAFVADTTPGAYERVVDRLLASPHYGERMAVDWLDAARYADTFGYQADRETHLWPWRDWVIRAFNSNMPYEEFLTDQIAGDLLPAATADQRLATAFNRLHRQTNEGGSVEEEFRLEYIGDRVETLGGAVLGLTLECARCHDHKFDPVTQKDFYKLSAFFSSIDESGLYSHFTETAPTPAMMLFEPGQEEKLAALREEIRERERALSDVEAKANWRFLKWLAAEKGNAPEPQPIVRLAFDGEADADRLRDSARPDKPASLSTGVTWGEGRSGQAAVFDGDGAVALDKIAGFERNDPFTISMWIRAAELKPRMILAHRSEASTDAASRGYEIRLDDGRIVFMLTHFWPGNAISVISDDAIPAEEWVHIAASYDGSSAAAGVRIYINGWPAPCQTLRDNLYKTIRYGNGGTPALRLGARFRDHGFEGGRIDDFRVYDRDLSEVEIAAVASGASVAEALAKAGADSQGVSAARAYFLSAVDEPRRAAREQLRAARGREVEFVESISQIMVMEEMETPRPTHVLGRGDYRNKLEQVAADTPGFLPPLPQDAPRNRLGLARWLLAPENPLTARVAVNRLWAQLFGRGLVTTPEDFGVQGEPPSNPALLDYLAARFRELNWDVKALLREIALSATYMQSSEASDELIRRDPDNTLLARGPRRRLSAEQIRDAALAASGLLAPRIGGPSVKPYQPEGIWRDSGSVDYKQDTGEALYRRGLYTFIKRTAPPPSMLLFDATNRETCIVNRERTETPLQALTLMNDPQYVEAARVLAERALTAETSGTDARIEMMFRRCVSRRPEPGQMKVLVAAHDEQRAWFAGRPDQAAAYVKTGETPVNDKIDAVELAAMTAVAQLIMNYDTFRMER